MPALAYMRMMCQRIGSPPISTIGLGRSDVSSLRRVPRPPARMTTFMRASCPGAPRGVARGPGVLERLAVAQGVHRLPEALVLVGAELAGGGERLHRLALPDGLLAGDEVQHSGLEDEEAAVDPAAGVAVRLLLEAAHEAALDLQRAPTAGRLDGGHGGRAPFAAVEVD